MKIKLGIQGTRGSMNERAAKLFIERQKWLDVKIVPLLTTEAVLKSLHEGIINYGTFAWETSRKGLVQETQNAVRQYGFTKLDEVILSLDHGLLCKCVQNINERQPVRIYGHPQGLIEHLTFLEQRFQNVELIEEVDSGYAAMRMQNDEYPPNSLIIASRGCAEIYDLELYLDDLPSNEGYWVKIFLVRTLV